MYSDKDWFSIIASILAILISLTSIALKVFFPVKTTEEVRVPEIQEVVQQEK